MEPRCVTLAVEGLSDASIARRILRHLNFDTVAIHGMQGKVDLDKCLPGYNYAAQFTPWFVLRDLDKDASCAPEFVTAQLPKPAEKMCFRLAVRAAEAWLLADRQRINHFFSIPLSKIPLAPDQLEDPKLTLVNLARKSHKKIIRVDMVPAQGSSTKIGPAYTARLIEFVNEHWRPEVAASHSDSLLRCIKALQSMFASGF